MTITEPRVVDPELQFSDDYASIHTICCRDENKTLCGVIWNDPTPPQPEDLDCITCSDLDDRDFCPVFLRCTGSDWNLS